MPNNKPASINSENNNEIENPYFNNRKGFTDRLDAERANTASWKFIAWFSNLITIIAVIGCIYAANLPDIVPFIFKEDGSGGLTAMGIASQEMHVNKQMVANQIGLFLIALREVPASVEIKKRYVTRVQMMSTQQLFHNVLAKMLKESYLRVGNGEVFITLKSIIPITKNTWELDWTEAGANGNSLGEYKATLTIELSKEFKNSSALIYNPIGLVVTDININKIIGS
ncbi:MAG: VirB8/TrbF family protein [Burkholderiales bacterium]|nr:VirB8/TrbF family protein [Burkholderiales bacterium]